MLRDARERAGLTQAQLAERAGVTQGLLSAYERGVRRPSLGTLERVLAALRLQARIELEPLWADVDRVMETGAPRWLVELDGLLARLEPLELVVDGAAAAALQGVPVEVQRLDVVVRPEDLGELREGLTRLRAQRWDERWQEFGGVPSDPAEPGAPLWSSSYGDVGVRYASPLPASLLVVADDRTVRVRPLLEVESDDPWLRRVLARLRERGAA